MELQLTDDERRLLIDILRGRLGELREEVYHATVSTFKDELKAREVVLSDLISRLEE